MRTKQYTSGDVWRRMPRPVAVSRSACARVLGSRTFALWYRVPGVVSHRLAQQRLERGLVYLVSLAKVYRPPRVPLQARVEEFLGIRQLGSVEERELHLVLVGVCEGVHHLPR